MTVLTHRTAAQKNRNSAGTRIPSASKAQELTGLSPQEVLMRLGGSQKGLSAREVTRSREKNGSNRLSGPTRTPLIVDIWNAFATPFTAVLLLLAAVSLVTDVIIVPDGQKDPSTVIIMVVMILLSGIISLVQARRSSAAVAGLLAKVRLTALVTRRERKAEIPVNDIVVGDLVTVAAGDMIPADMRLISSRDLFCSTSSLNGESEPVEKTADAPRKTGLSPASSYLDLQDVCYEGTTVVSGSGTGVVFAVGADTVFGSLAHSLNQYPGEKTSFQKGISAVSRLLLVMTAVIAPLVLLINGLTKGNWSDALLFAIATAVGLTPEMLPVIVTSNLVRGSVVMSRKGTIVKHMDSIQNFGAADVLATDKTGTLTQGRDVLDGYIDLDGHDSSDVLTLGYLNARYQTGTHSQTDKVITQAARETLDTQSIEKAYWKTDELPFDFHRRRLSVVIQRQDGRRLLITKGAAEEMLACSTMCRINGKNEPLTDERRTQIKHRVAVINATGRRVLLLAIKRDPRPAGVLTEDDESDMLLMGCLVFLDPPKDTAAYAVADLKKHGLRVKVLTGDNEAVARTVCGKVGISTASVLTGADIEGMDADELTRSVDRCDIFAKLTPDDKTAVVAALRRAGHTVAFMGDGINDAPAMKQADVSVSVNTAVDVAKETADIILLHPDLRVLGQGVLLGRQVLINTMKYIKITLSSNFGNILSVIVASLFLPFLPMLPLQLLVLDLIYGASCIAIPFDHVDPRSCVRPRRWTTRGLIPFMLSFGPISSLIDIATFALLFFVICPMTAGAWNPASATAVAVFAGTFHAGWFIESLWTQEMVIHALRDPRLPFIRQHASLSLTLSTLGVCVLGTLLVFTPVSGALDFGTLPPVTLALVAVLLVVYFLLVTVAKTVYIHGSQQRRDLFL